MRLSTWSGLAVLAAVAMGCGGAPEPEGDAGDVIAETAEDGLHTSSGPRVSLHPSRALQAGTSTSLELRVRTASGAPISAFEVEHTKLMHLVVVSRDLSYFTHVHPTYVGQGSFRIDWTPPSFDDNYAVYAQFKPRNAAATSTVRFAVHVPGTTMKVPVPVTEATAPVTSGFSRLTLHPPTAGYKIGSNNFHFAVTDTRTNAPAQLGTFLGAKAHVIAVKAGAADRVFVHGHDMGDQSAAPGGGHGGHGATPPPASGAGAGNLSFDLELAEPGLYRLWVQYNQGGRDITQFVTVNVAASTSPTCDYSAPYWVGRSVEECSTIMAACIPGTTWFSNTCGCGCRQ